jgi:hypothetical protein
MGAKSSKKQSTNLQAESYYKNLIQNDINSDTGFGSSKTQIQMNIGLKNAEQWKDYSVKIQISDSENNKNYKLIGETEKSQADESKIINFNFILILDYYFERQQNLIFTIYKNGEIFSISTTVGNVMGSRGQVLIKDFPQEQPEKLFISASGVKNHNISVNLTLSVVFNLRNASIFYVIKKPKLGKELMSNNLNTNININPDNSLNSSRSTHMTNTNTPSNQFVSVYKSEVRNSSNTNFVFYNLKIPFSVISGGEGDCPILIEFHDYYSQSILGSYTTTTDKLTFQDKNFQVITNQGIPLLVSANCQYIKEFTFLDYLKGGLQLALSIGIDFTGSNGHPLDQGSLHFAGSHPNSYEKAIRSCGDIVAYYDYDQLFPVYGYGAVLPGSNQVSHCFNLNFNPQDPNVHMIDEVLTTYRNAVTKINFSGPTLFAPLINHAINTIKLENKKNQYNILLILTDGMINDMDDTINALVEGSFLPLSVIIVGIGRADFGNMSVLDADDSPLIDSRGKKAVRDLVQFVPFYQFENDGRLLAQNVLEEVPRQVVEYFRNQGIAPGDPLIPIA